MPQDEPQGLLEELEDIPPEEQQHTVSQMLVKQQVALNSLVAHLASQDGLHELGVSGSASSSISLKGSAKRERLLSDLAARRSDFFLKVAQNAHRRLKPAEAVPQALEEFPRRPSSPSTWNDKEDTQVTNESKGLLCGCWVT